MRKYALCAATLCTAMMSSVIAAEFTAADLAKEEGKFAAYSASMVCAPPFWSSLRRNPGCCARSSV